MIKRLFYGLEQNIHLSYWGVKIRRISLNNAFTPSFSPLSIYNKIMCIKFF